MAFALLPVLFGLGIMKYGLREKVTNKHGVFIAFFGLLGLLVWAGLLAGPLLAFLAIILPEKVVDSS
jgi:hypothetical protein